MEFHDQQGQRTNKFISGLSYKRALSVMKRMNNNNLSNDNAKANMFTSMIYSIFLIWCLGQHNKSRLYAPPMTIVIFIFTLERQYI